MADKRSSPYYERGDKYAHGERVAALAVHLYPARTDKQYSNTVRIHQDADHLDHFGSLGIWRTVTYTMGYKGKNN